MISQEIKDVKEEFLLRLKKQNVIAPTVPPLIFLEIGNYSDEIIEYSLGDFGKKLKLLAQEVDTAHPDLNTIFNGVLAAGSPFEHELRELLFLASFAKENDLTLFKKISRIISLTEYLDNQRIESPSLTARNVRFVKSKSERDSIRVKKKFQNIDLTIFLKKGIDAWNAQPCSFKKFLRFDTAYDDEIMKAEKVAQRYSDLGCRSLYDEVKRNIDNFKQQVADNYRGFNRISVANVAVILAKSLDYQYQEKYYNIDGEWEISRITVPKLKLSTNYIENVKMTPSGNYIYQPRIYPFYELFDIAPEHVVQTINYLEEFPEANYKPIFDHFAIIVPGIQCENDPKDMDISFIKNECFSPVVVAEKDGKCYFVCYWIK